MVVENLTLADLIVLEGKVSSNLLMVKNENVDLHNNASAGLQNLFQNDKLQQHL